jgi:glucokinase
MQSIDPKILKADERVILTLDAGGTKLAFSALRGAKECIEPFTVPSAPHDANAFLAIVAAGFERALEEAGGKAEAISFGFPGPADYEEGIIGDLPNLKGFRGGVALGPFLAARFGIPVFINNDGNLFALGEWAFGFRTWVNEQLVLAGSKKQYQNLIGVTLGTGFGCGIVVNGRMITGDNGAGGEIWLFRNKLEPDSSVETICGRYGIQRLYARLADCIGPDLPEANAIEDIALGKRAGNRKAAEKTFEIFGEVAGDALAFALTLIDGLVVVGGGIAHAAGLFMPSLMKELTSTIRHVLGEDVPRTVAKPYWLGDPSGLTAFIESRSQEVDLPGGSGTIVYDTHKRTGIGLSKLGTGRAISLGAYIYAIEKLENEV